MGVGRGVVTAVLGQNRDIVTIFFFLFFLVLVPVSVLVL